MSDEQAPFELLKSFPGLILRQPIFNASDLNVETYHFSFFDNKGQTLKDDEAVPDFMSLLPDLIPLISDKPKLLLSIPRSWEESLQDGRPSTLHITVDNRTDSPVPNTRFDNAQRSNAINDEVQSNLLLVNFTTSSEDTLKVNVPKWTSKFEYICASNVNTLEQYQFSLSQSINLIEGQFYTLPTAKDGHKISPSMQSLMELLVKLQDPEVEPEDIAITISQDISLSYKLLRLVNSAFFGLPREVNSIKDAIVILGLTKVKTWASLLGLSNVDEKPVELRIIAMARARMCELLANHYKGQAELFFTAGLFSALDALMDTPLDSLVDKLPLSDALKMALLNHQGPVGEALNDVLNYENANWDAVINSSTPNELLLSTYLDALKWAQELYSQLNK